MRTNHKPRQQGQADPWRISPAWRGRFVNLWPKYNIISTHLPSTETLVCLPGLSVNLRVYVLYFPHSLQVLSPVTLTGRMQESKDEFCFKWQQMILKENSTLKHIKFVYIEIFVNGWCSIVIIPATSLPSWPALTSQGDTVSQLQWSLIGENNSALSSNWKKIDLKFNHKINFIFQLRSHIDD